MRSRKTGKKNRNRYIYTGADGTKFELIPGQDGVTKEWVNYLHEADDEEFRAQQKENYYAPKRLDDVFGEGSSGDKDYLLCDMRYEPTEMIQADAEVDEYALLRVKLWGALKALPEKQRETIKKLFFEGKSLVEIAVEEGVSGVAVIKRRDAALVNLKNFLKN